MSSMKMLTMMTLTPMEMLILWNYQVTLLSPDWSATQSVSSGQCGCEKYFHKMKQIFLCLILITSILCDDDTSSRTGKSLVRRRKLISSPNHLQLHRVMNFHKKSLTTPQRIRALVKKKIKKIIKSKSTKNVPSEQKNFNTLDTRNSINNMHNR